MSGAVDMESADSLKPLVPILLQYISHGTQNAKVRCIIHRVIRYRTRTWRILISSCVIEKKKRKPAIPQCN